MLKKPSMFHFPTSLYNLRLLSSRSTLSYENTFNRLLRWQQEEQCHQKALLSGAHRKQPSNEEREFKPQTFRIKNSSKLSQYWLHQYN